MDDTLHGGIQPAATTAGDRLRAAREAAGLSLAEIGARTRVPLRQLEAVEQSRYDALRSSTYAVGFAKAYARVVGLDEVAIGAMVRGELARFGPRHVEYEPYELPDPARVPSRGLAVLGIGAALAVVILAALWFGTDLFNSRGGAPGAVPGPTPTATSIAAAPPIAPTMAAVPPALSGGQVRLTANDEVWLRVYDADNKTLFLGTMKPGDHFDVPADANGPKINVGRADKLAVTLDGRPVPPLGNGEHAIKDVDISGATIAARLRSTPEGSPSATATDAVGTHEHHSERQSRTEQRPKPHRRVLTETQRANLDSAATPPAATGTPR